ncbi:MAG: polyprenyl synthetase family protein [Deltaproteobacteria bacterium]|nr:polyprenyl synthetase family protein [Deltaproteobacteria bacterium]
MMTTISEARLLEWRARWITAVNQALSEAFSRQAEGQPPEVANLLTAMNYTVESGGKRLRALLTLAAAEAVGGREELGLPGALAVEMIHAYSLIHDDLPALDNDELRRGKPTCHLAYGEATAILAGDALQSLAFETLASGVNGRDEAAQRLRAINVLSRAIGPVGMVGGQAMDLAFEGASPAKAQVLEMEGKKTGHLIGACLAVGATLGGAEPNTVDKLREIGQLAGLAFQITDDLLNVNGDPKLMGKNVGTDAQKAKATITAVLSQAEATDMVKSLVGQALPHIYGIGSEKLAWLIGSIVGRTS